MRKYRVVDVICGLREEYKRTYSDLKSLKELIVTSDDLDFDKSQIVVHVENKDSLGFYLMKRNGKFKQIGKYYFPKDKSINDLQIINDELGIAFKPARNEELFGLINSISENAIISHDPINYNFVNGNNYSFSINNYRTGICEQERKFTNSIVEYVASLDLMHVISEFKDEHISIMINGLKQEIPKEVLPKTYQKLIDNPQYNNVFYDGKYDLIHESCYAFSEDYNKDLTLKKVYSIKH